VPYLRERVPAWIEGKRRDFVDRMTTAAGRRAALARLERLTRLVQALQEELDACAAAMQSGRLAVLRYFFLNRRNPSLSEQLDYLKEKYLEEMGAGPAAAEFVSLLCQETDGRL